MYSSRRKKNLFLTLVLGIKSFDKRFFEAFYHEKKIDKQEENVKFWLKKMRAKEKSMTIKWSATNLRENLLNVENLL